MSIDEIPENPIPLWAKIVIIVSCLPMLAFPWLLELCPAGSSEETFLWIYPFYVLVAAFCAWKSYGRRATVSWVIVALLWLTHGAMWLLVDPSLLLS